MKKLSRFTTGDGCSIAYRFDGASDTPVLLMSGSLAVTLEMWNPIISDLTQEYRVLRYDLRGHGRSDVPEGSYSLDRFGHDVLELLDHLELEKVHFCGTSVGGVIGQWLGIVQPTRLHRLVLSNTSSYAGPAPQWNETIRHTLGDEIATTADGLLKTWFAQPVMEQQPEVVAFYRSMILGTSRQGLAAGWAAVRDTDLRRTVSTIEVPTLVIAGQDDISTPSMYSEAIAQAVAGSTLRSLPGRHMLVAEHPSEYANLVLEFLRG